MIHQVVDVFLHLDRHLAELTAQYGPWVYAILFAIVFLETGVVVTPFLPGDSLLFAAGALAAIGQLDVAALFVVLSLAAVLGDTANYHIGKYIGPHAFTGKVRFLKREHLDRTHAFYEKYGAKTIVLARFVPIVRTFAPFVAGIGYMSYLKFLTYNVVGGVGWVAICIFAGYGFGNIPVIQRNFSLVILAIIFVSILPIVFEYLKARRAQADRS